eukprot:5710595-Pyramimonas_sp.AAC.2
MALGAVVHVDGEPDAVQPAGRHPPRDPPAPAPVHEAVPHAGPELCHQLRLGRHHLRVRRRVYGGGAPSGKPPLDPL